MILQQRDQHSRRRNYGIVQRMNKVCTVLALCADLQAACLRITEIRAGADLEIFLLTRRPCFDIAGLDLEVCQITRTAFELTHRDLHAAEQINRELPHLVVPVHTFLRLAENDHFLLLELVDAVNAALLQTVRTDLLAEAGRIGCQLQRERAFIDDLIDEPADHRMLRGADQIEILALDLIHHRFHFLEGHNALDNASVHHERRDHIGEAVVDHEISCVCENCFMQTRNVAHEIIETGSGNSACCILVKTAQSLHDIRVIRDLVIRNDRLTKALDLDILAVVLADRHRCINDLRDALHDVIELCAQLVHDGFLFLHGDGIFLDLCLDRLSLILFAGLHENRNLCRELIALCAEILRDMLCLKDLCIQLRRFINERKLVILKLLFDIFLDSFLVVYQKLNINHDELLLYNYFVTIRLYADTSRTGSSPAPA